MFSLILYLSINYMFLPFVFLILLPLRVLYTQGEGECPSWVSQFIDTAKGAHPSHANQPIPCLIQLIHSHQAQARTPFLPDPTLCQADSSQHPFPKGSGPSLAGPGQPRLCSQWPRHFSWKAPNTATVK